MIETADLLMLFATLVLGVTLGWMLGRAHAERCDREFLRRLAEQHRVDLTLLTIASKRLRQERDPAGKGGEGNGKC